MKPCLEECFPMKSGVQIIAEPGRYFVTNGFQICCNVISIRDCRIRNDEVSMVSEESMSDSDKENATYIEEDFMYYINDGIYNSFNCVVAEKDLCSRYIIPHYVEQVYTTPMHWDIV